MAEAQNSFIPEAFMRVVPQSNDWAAMAAASRVDLNKEPTSPPVVLWIVENGKQYQIATLGNISVIIGKAKSRKTFAASLFIASLLSAEPQTNIQRGLPVSGKCKVIVFDTEQAIFKVYQVGKRAQNLSGNTSDVDFQVHSLRSKSVPERVGIIEHVLYSNDDILFVVVDGLRDLLHDINDPGESSDLVGKFMKWSEERNIHIMTVLHQNKGDNNARGHVGTEVVNKAETVLSVVKDEKQPEMSIVSPEYSREMDFPPFAFIVGEDGMPRVIESWSGKTQSPGKTKGPCDLPLETHKKILERIFSEKIPLRRSDLDDMTKVALNGFSLSSSNEAVRLMIAYYVSDRKWILKEGKDRSPNATYSFDPLSINN